MIDLSCLRAYMVKQNRIFICLKQHFSQELVDKGNSDVSAMTLFHVCALRLPRLINIGSTCAKKNKKPTMSQEKFVGAVQKKKSARDLFNPVITPENIPQFTIPSLSILEGSRIFPAKKFFAWRSHQWHRRSPDPFCKTTHGLSSVRLDDLPGPVTSAAMSLPHLPQISTPYGFLTLGESPHIARQESFFFQIRTSIGLKPTGKCDDPQNSLISEIPKAENISHVPQYPVNTTESSVGTSILYKLPGSQKLVVSRRTSIPFFRSRTFGQVNKSEWVAPFLTQRSNSLPKIITRRSSQTLFQSVLKKPLNLKQIKSSSLDLVENDKM